MSDPVAKPLSKGQRILGLDYGTVRLGVAISDPTGTVVRPLPPMPAKDRGALVKQVAELCQAQGVGEIVLGLPRHMNGSEGDSAKQTRVFGEALLKRTGLPLHYLDERLTTAAVQRTMLEADMSRADRKGKVDGLAAALILETWLARKAGGGLPVIPPIPPAP